MVTTGETRRRDVRSALRAALPAGLALVPLGLALGVLVVQKGFAWWWAPILAAFIYAGSLEFLMVGMLAAIAPLTQIAMTSLLVNFRHAFYALSFPLHRVTSVPGKAYSTFTLSDEAYAVTSSAEAEGWSGAKIVWTQFFLRAFWISSVAVGAGLGSLIPPGVQGLDFAVTALFVVLAMEAYRVRPSVPITILAFVCSMVGSLWPGQMLVISMGLFTAPLVSAYVVRRRRGSSFLTVGLSRGRGVDGGSTRTCESERGEDNA
ncbi:AzlC family ABC transporter permease [Arcanobacterium haemolyticum]|nr:AzlC family ABC transporter permease [Arcanobacterium haemolyticum]